MSEHFLDERLQASAILESLSEGVIALHARGEILSINPAARTLLGLEVGVNFFETSRHGELHELIRQVLAAGQRATRDVALYFPRPCVLRAQGVPCQTHVVLVVQDVTDHHRYDQLRREFVANVSHELKSPLTSIRSLTETLLDGGLEDPGCNRRFISLIEEDSCRLSRLIDDLLTLSQVESRAVPLQPQQVELLPLVESAVAPLEVLVADKNLKIQFDIPDGLLVRADPDRLRQVLDNLVDNAAKYSPVGGVLALRAWQREGGPVHVAVQDQGPGIPDEARYRVFERFYRVDRTRSRELGGTGLGLSIVKHIVESHGGRVWVDSVVGQGCTFCFTLPEKLPTGETPAPIARPHWNEPEQLRVSADIPSELSALQERLLAMAGLAEEAVGSSVQALLLRDGRLARQVLERDPIIDQAELAIDELCLQLLSEHRPDPADLRLISMAFKINAELERIGDLAVNIAHRTLELLREPLLQPLFDISTMAQRVQAMVKDSLDALVNRDSLAAAEVCRRDDEVDRLNERVFQSMLLCMRNDHGSVDRALGLLLIARSLERIADHATNIAEAVVYLVSGQNIKHRQLDP